MNITEQVRDIYLANPDITNDELIATLPYEKPNTLRTILSRFRHGHQKVRSHLPANHRPSGYPARYRPARRLPALQPIGSPREQRMRFVMTLHEAGLISAENLPKAMAKAME